MWGEQAFSIPLHLNYVVPSLTLANFKHQLKTSNAHHLLVHYRHQVVQSV